MIYIANRMPQSYDCRHGILLNFYHDNHDKSPSEAINKPCTPLKMNMTTEKNMVIFDCHLSDFGGVTTTYELAEKKKKNFH